MNYLALLKGPYMIGLLFVIVGLLQRFLPPKSINSWYGYRSIAAKVNQQTWDAANRYSSTFMIKAGMIFFLLGFIIYLLTNMLKLDVDVQRSINYFILFGGAIGIGAITAMVTERHLARTFKVKIKDKKKSK